MNETTEVLIAGAGIGGLTAALTLHAQGIRSTVIESASEMKPLGVGINLLPHAVRELAELGLSDELARTAAEPIAISFFDEDGRLLFSEPGASQAATPGRSTRCTAANCRCCCCPRSATGWDPTRCEPAQA
jgi:2-polyprenyl-6-methoxyphenol hydroxylase-like FAD-dependent oxidoreductase